jgi:probable rRNA maturation factor
MPPDGQQILYRRAGTALDRREIRAFADQLREQVADGRPFTCLLTDDRELERLNRMFFGKDYPTDVLSFPSGSAAGPVGEIAISVQRAKEQAAEHGHDTVDEIRILMLHGVLHLLGMDHEGDRGSMARTEKRWRQQLQLPLGLIERSRARKAKK